MCLSIINFALMYFKSTTRKNPETGKFDGYYRLVESYRNISGRVCHRTLLNIGFLPNVSAEQLNAIKDNLNNRITRQLKIFDSKDPIVNQLSNELWNRLSAEKKIDIADIGRMVKVDSIKHKDVREIGAEYLGQHAWEQLQLNQFLHRQGWTKEQINLTATQVISRAVYPTSELRTSKWIKENSAICELTNYPIGKMTKDKLYGSALKLYEVKDELEKHLSNRTNDLFNLSDKIVLYDLTNTYFEGRKTKSQLAQFGRSKEKRSDAKLVVLALVINLEGFIKYSNIYEGNIADNETLEQMITKLSNHTCSKHKPVVVLDAGIATEDNLKMLKERAYDYVCVSRSKLKDYKTLEKHNGVVVKTKGKHPITLTAVRAEGKTDYFIKVKSHAKQAKEQGMKTAFENRFELILEKINASLNKKGGTKTIPKVFERIGRAKEKYPSIQSLYQIKTEIDEQKGVVSSLTWTKHPDKEADKNANLGVYFVRTSLDIEEETTLWEIYNAIREIESTFRCLKTDLDMRPIYHQNDDSTMAHLHLAILAYWLVNTIRHQLKLKNIRHSWTEIVRIANTQKIVTTQGQNTYDKIITIKRCNEPNEKLRTIYEALEIKSQPFTKRKSVVHKTEFEKEQKHSTSEKPPD